MNIFYRIMVVVLAGIILIIPNAFADKTPLHIVWNKTPINVVLPVGQERMVSFPAAVSLGYDQGILTADKLRVQNNDGTLYLLAKQKFQSQRVEVKILNTDKIILLNLSARQNTDNVPLDIVVGSDDNDLVGSDQKGIANNAATLPVDDATLLQRAVDYLYAPDRLVKEPTYMYRVSMHTARTVSLVLDGSVIAMPKISWRAGDKYITAVTIRNITHFAIKLNPYGFCGDWNATSIFPLKILRPAGTYQNGFPLDSTTAFLVSEKPFSDAVNVCNGQEE